ncbi:MAG: GIY-YIG nuclease family protein [Candidatus Riflebacteria bacterium]|nr:GIY-YIG nuclease family protein [Candidatus Riflebacteria bacterium]
MITLTWTSDKYFGKSLKFALYKKTDAERLHCAGIYMFIKYEPINVFYVGQTECFSDRLSNHERWSEAVKFGANYIAVAEERNETLRLNLEKIMINELQPPLNEQFK